MTHNAASIAAVWACVAVLLAPPAARAAEPEAAPPSAIALGPGSTLWLDGKSNMHDFTSRTATVSIRFAGDPGSAGPATPAEVAEYLRTAVRSLDVAVPVTTLLSSKSGLDKNLWQDLRSEKHPEITFHLTSHTVKPAGASGDTLEIKAEGTLTVAGTARPIALTTRAYPAAQGYWVDGEHALRMTEFGIKPRTMMLGTLRVKDEVVVHWHLLLVPADK